jgi:hypothetical protein
LRRFDAVNSIENIKILISKKVIDITQKFKLLGENLRYNLYFSNKTQETFCQYGSEIQLFWLLISAVL